MMPVRTRLQAAPVREVDAVSAFRWSDTGDGCSHGLGDPHFRDRQEAGPAWERVRRQVWAQAHRFTVPDAAKIYDGLSTAGLDFVRWHWNHERFNLAGALEALAEDRAHLQAFEQTRGARQIDDYLALFHADLDLVEHTARQLATRPDDTRWESYPGHLNTCTTYGHVTP